MHIRKAPSRKKGTSMGEKSAQERKNRKDYQGITETGAGGGEKALGAGQRSKVFVACRRERNPMQGGGAGHVISTGSDREGGLEEREDWFRNKEVKKHGLAMVKGGLRGPYS